MRNEMACGYNGNPTYFNLNQTQYNTALEKVQEAQAAWTGMVQQFGAENMAMGMSSTIANEIELALQEVNLYGSQGLLWLAFDALSYVEITPQMSPYLTPDRIQYMKNQIIQAVGNL
jgi:hypothetical protein